MSDLKATETGRIGGVRFMVWRTCGAPVVVADTGNGAFICQRGREAEFCEAIGSPTLFDPDSRLRNGIAKLRAAAAELMASDAHRDAGATLLECALDAEEKVLLPRL